MTQATAGATAQEVLASVGGAGNVADLTHCMTRLRFSLTDPSRADRVGLEKIDGVISVIESGGQLQLVMPDQVNDIYDELAPVVAAADQTSSSGAPSGILGRAVDVITAIFTPIIPALAGAGVLKGLLILLSTIGWLADGGGVYQVLWGVADAMFYFLPIMLAVTTARRFKADAFVSVTVAGALIYPPLMEAMAGEEPLSFLGLPLLPASYAYSVIPVIVAIWALSLLERWLTRVIPRPIRLFTVPLICFIIITPLTFLVFGPLGTTVATWLAEGVMALYGLSPLVAGFVTSGLWQVLVMFGLHWGSMPIIFNNLSQFGYDVLLPLTGPAVFGQAGAALAVALKTRNARMRSVAGAAATSALFGITEPAIYGVTLRLRRPFVAGSLAAAFGGAIAGAGGAQALAVAPASIASLPIFLGPGFVAYLIGCGVALVLGLVLTWFSRFVDEATPAPAQPAGDTRDEVLGAVVAGTVVPLDAVSDKAFARGALGSGVAIRPEADEIRAPAAGTVVTSPDMKHALGMRTTQGAEVLIHIGIDTVRLDGEHFTTHYSQGQRVEAGDLLVSMDRAAITDAGYDTTVIVTITNSATYTTVAPTQASQITPAQPLLTVVG
ncbi:MAG: beta-glucoside-specific PTS transporter subunit IIABC [Propioniciclava sp.]